MLRHNDYEENTDKLKWKFETGDWIHSTPAIDTNGTVYFGSNDGNLYAMSGQSGEMQWSFQTGGGIGSNILLGNNNTVFFGTWDNKVIAVDTSSGSRKWELNVLGEVYGLALGKLDIIYFGTYKNSITPELGVSGTFFAVDCNTGEILWEFEVANGIDSIPSVSNDETVYFGSRDGNLYALDGKTGNLKWFFQADGQITSGVAIDKEQKIFFGSQYDNKVYSLDGRTGNKIWEFETNGSMKSSPTLGSNGMLYIGSWGKHFLGIDALTGQEKWRFETREIISSAGETLSGVNTAGAISSDGTIYIGSQDSYLYALNGQTGTLEWEFKTGERIDSSPLIGPDGTVYFGSFDKKFYALQGSSGPDNSAPWPMLSQNQQRTGVQKEYPEDDEMPISQYLISVSDPNGQAVVVQVGNEYRWNSSLDGVTLWGVEQSSDGWSAMTMRFENGRNFGNQGFFDSIAQPQPYDVPFEIDENGYVKSLEDDGDYQYYNPVSVDNGVIGTIQNDEGVDSVADNGVNQVDQWFFTTRAAAEEYYYSKVNPKDWMWFDHYPWVYSNEMKEWLYFMPSGGTLMYFSNNHQSWRKFSQ